LYRMDRIGDGRDRMGGSCTRALRWYGVRRQGVWAAATVPRRSGGRTCRMASRFESPARQQVKPAF